RAAVRIISGRGGAGDRVLRASGARVVFRAVCVVRRLVERGEVVESDFLFGRKSRGAIRPALQCAAVVVLQVRPGAHGPQPFWLTAGFFFTLAIFFAFLLAFGTVLRAYRN